MISAEEVAEEYRRWVAENDREPNEAELEMFKAGYDRSQLDVQKAQRLLRDLVGHLHAIGDEPGLAVAQRALRAAGGLPAFKDARDAAEQMQNIAGMLERALGGLGFFVLVFDFGKEPDRYMNWVGNGQQEDMVAALHELLASWEGRLPTGAVGHA